MVTVGFLYPVFGYDCGICHWNGIIGHYGPIENGSHLLNNWLFGLIIGGLNWRSPSFRHPPDYLVFLSSSTDSTLIFTPFLAAFSSPFFFIFILFHFFFFECEELSIWTKKMIQFKRTFKLSFF